MCVILTGTSALGLLFRILNVCACSVTSCVRHCHSISIMWLEFDSAPIAVSSIITSCHLWNLWPHDSYQDSLPFEAWLATRQVCPNLTL